MPRSTASTGSVDTDSDAGSFHDPEDTPAAAAPAVDFSFSSLGLVPADDFMRPAPLADSVRTKVPTIYAPRLLSTSITTQNVKELNELLQTPEYARARLRLEWDFQDSGPRGFTATLRFVDRVTGETVQELVGDVPCANKKQAKEHAAGRGLDWARRDGRAILERTKTNNGELAADIENDTHDWVSLVNELCQKCGGRPEWQYYALPNAGGFYCELRLPESLGIPGIGARVFGGPSAPASRKKTAQKAAAKLAILHVKQHTASGAGAPASPPGEKSKLPPIGTLIKLNKHDSTLKKLNDACKQLGITHEFKLEPAPGIGVWDVKLFLHRLGARTGLVRRDGVYGKVNAKNAVAEQALAFVKNDEAKRLGVQVVEVEMEEE